VGNTTKRDAFLGGEKNMTRNDTMAVQVVVHIADAGDVKSEERLKSVLEGPIKDAKLPLGADVTVSRVSVQDFDECSSDEYNDCSDQADCSNSIGSYACSCRDGFHDLSSPDALPGRVCSGECRPNAIHDAS
jgi:hypothetical protein